jgi:hypothetical protein
LQVLFVLLRGHKSKFLFSLVREEQTRASVGHDANANKYARLGRGALVPSAKLVGNREEGRGWIHSLPDGHDAGIVVDPGLGSSEVEVGSWELGGSASETTWGRTK